MTITLIYVLFSLNYNSLLKFVILIHQSDLIKLTPPGTF